MKFISRIKNIIRWIPILWKDRDWDQYYIFEILKTKLKFQSEHLRKSGCHWNSEYDANKIDLCIKLIDRVQNEYYIELFYDMEGDKTLTDAENAINKHNKAKRILFKLLDQYIESWWD